MKKHRIKSTKSERREEKKRPKMPISGRSVFLVRNLRRAAKKY